MIRGRHLDLRNRGRNMINKRMHHWLYLPIIPISLIGGLVAQFDPGLPETWKFFVGTAMCFVAALSVFLFIQESSKK